MPALTPTFSVVVPTYNSARTLGRSLAAVRAQDFDQAQIEILVIDGGSTDATVDIAREHGARVIPNPRRLPEIAKFIGVREARGEFVVFSDSDEVVLRTDAFSLRARAFKTVPDAHTLATEGNTRPPSCPKLLDYYNLVGDPFTYFVNRQEIVAEYAAKRFAARYEVSVTDPDFYALRLRPGDAPPMFDAGGHTFRRQTFVDLAREKLEANDASCVGTISSVLSGHSGTFLVSRNDFVDHYSDASVRLILAKTKFRIINNLFMAQGGAAGYVERERYLPERTKRRKYLFLLYGASVVAPTIDGVALSIHHKNPAFLWHPVFAFATVGMLGWYVAMSKLGMKTTVASYGK